MRAGAILLFVLLAPRGVVAQGVACPLAKPGTVYVRGEVAKPFELDSANWRQFPQVSVSAQGHGTPAGSYSGIPLSALLARAGMQGAELRGKAVAQVVVIEASDGYRAAFGLAELDSAFVDRVVLLANRFADKPLEKDYGPFQVIVQGEKRHARWVREVTCIRVVTPG